MEKILTIVVPTYNMEMYLDKCLSSLVISNKAMNLLEVLVINDGSKDNSSQIAHKYENNYPETFRVIDKQNGHYGSCINRGLKEAKAKYIKVLDADDWFDTEALNNFVFKLVNIHSDMVLTDYSYVFMTNGRKKVVNLRFQPEKYYDAATFLCDKSIVYFQMHAVTYSVKLLRDMHYVQTEGVSYTDQDWMFYPMQFIKNVFYVNLNVYQYLLGREGQTVNYEIRRKFISQNYPRLKRIVNFYPNINSISEKERKCFFINKLHKTIDYPYKILLLAPHKPTLENLEELESFDNDILINCPELYD
ncbi:MAG: glycosyltransferase family 2 protein, partial [Prevotella sp.]|nr:glycosyltransferase family 2 protein [Prevotella sp.]